jgi:hypothetical protein
MVESGGWRMDGARDGERAKEMMGRACRPPSSHTISLMSGFQMESFARAAAAAAAAAEKEEEEEDGPVFSRLLMEIRGPRKSASPTALAEAASETRQDSAAAADAAADDDRDDASGADAALEDNDRILARE